MSTNEQLCLNLLRADTEEEVIAILKAAGYWRNPNAGASSVIEKTIFQPLEINKADQKPR